MTTFSRNLHRFCVVFQGAWAVIWASAYSQHPSGLLLFNFIWCVAFGAYSFHMLRKDRKGGEA